jgi:hypothetical protein
MPSVSTRNPTESASDGSVNCDCSWWPYARPRAARGAPSPRELPARDVQMHGGIGMTDEHDIGFFLKRARVAELTFGDAAYHRRPGRPPRRLLIRGDGWPRAADHRFRSPGRRVLTGIVLSGDPYHCPTANRTRIVKRICGAPERMIGWGGRGSGGLIRGGSVNSAVCGSYALGGLAGLMAIRALHCWGPPPSATLVPDQSSSPLALPGGTAMTVPQDG